MQNENNQQLNTQLTPDQIMASLGLATRISENLLRQQNPAQMEESMGEPMEQPMDEMQEPIEEPIEPTEEVELEEEPEEITEEEPETEEEKSSFLDEVKTTIQDGFESVKKLFKKQETNQE